MPSYDWRATTAGNMTVSPGSPLEHVACDTAIAGLRARAEAAEAKLAAIRDRCLERRWAPHVDPETVQALIGILAIIGSEGQGRA